MAAPCTSMVRAPAEVAVSNSIVRLVLLVPACLACTARQHLRWTPILTSDVPDSTLVRATDKAFGSQATGRAVGWQRGQLRHVVTAGDTLRAPGNATLEVYTGRQSSYALPGGIVGWAIGIGAVLSSCGLESYCGEQDFRPALGALLGALVGSLLKHDRWVRVRRDSSVSGNGAVSRIQGWGRPQRPAPLT